MAGLPARRIRPVLPRHDPAAPRPERIQPPFLRDPPRSGHPRPAADRAWAMSRRPRRPRQLAGERISRIIISPYTRALQTAAPSPGARASTSSSTRSCASAMPSPATSVRRGPSSSGLGRIMISLRSTKSGGRRSRSRPTSCIGRAALFRAEMAALPDWSDTAGREPLGLHPVADRHERDERPVAALRPDRAGTRADHLAGLTAERPAR